MTPRERLAARQRELVRALVAGAAAPAGFDESRVRATARALLSKRAGEIAATWPRLRVGLDDRFRQLFFDWADGRPPLGALVDGFLFAGDLADADALPQLGAEELADVRACLFLTSRQHLHRRPGFAVGRATIASSDGGGTAITYAVRGRILHRRRGHGVRSRRRQE
ncbi:hypothetical protein [Fodinicola acaciae]|uniref:hypothetical protein n=1 Tax=Fodinicola acaciae TaxID=2681555 RepID=UPI0013D25292|nr:hypothetical protein [Fodinicola acaciae]